MQYLYSRVSTDRQDTENQLNRLRELYPNASVVEECASGAKARPMLQRLVGDMREGDELIVFALDRLGRRTAEVLTLIEDLYKRGIILKSVREGVSYDSLSGKLVLQVLASVAELERGLIAERTKAALAARKKQGVKLGAPSKYGAEVVKRIIELKAQGATCRQVARLTGVSASRVSQLLRKHDNCLKNSAVNPLA